MTFPWKYFAFGFGIRSERPLPELTESDVAGDQTVDIRWAKFPSDLAGARYRDRVLQVGGSDIQITVRDVARFLLHGGIQITIDVFPEASPRDVRAYLLGTAFGVLCHQRALLPLHANAVEIDGHAIAFAGNSGAGKSTLAAYFDREGYNLLSDDVCAVSFPDAGPPLAWPGIPRIRLWKDSADALGKDVEGMERLVSRFEKYDCPRPIRLRRDGLPLQRIYVLSDPRKYPSAGIFRLIGADAMEAVMAQTFRREFLKLIGAAQGRFDRAVALVANVQVFRVPWQHDFRMFPIEAAKLIAHASSDFVACS